MTPLPEGPDPASSDATVIAAAAPAATPAMTEESLPVATTKFGGDAEGSRLEEFKTKAEKTLGDEAEAFLDPGEGGVSKFDSVLAAMTDEVNREKLLAGDFDLSTKEYLFALKIEEQTRHLIAAKPVDGEPAKKEEEIKASDIAAKERAVGTPKFITDFMKAVDDGNWVKGDDKASFKNRIEVTRLADGTEGIGVRCNDQKSLQAAFTQLAKQGCTSFEMQVHDRTLTSGAYVSKMKAMADGLSDSKAEMSEKTVSITKDAKEGGATTEATMHAKTFIMLAQVAEKIRENKGEFGSGANSSLSNVISIVNKNMTGAGIEGAFDLEDLDSSTKYLEKYHAILDPSPKEYKTVSDALAGTGPQLAQYSEFNVTASNSGNAQAYLNGVQVKLNDPGNSASDITVNLKGPDGGDQETFTMEKGKAAPILTPEQQAKIDKNDSAPAAPASPASSAAPPAPSAAPPAPSTDGALVPQAATTAVSQVAIMVNAAKARGSAATNSGSPAVSGRSILTGMATLVSSMAG